MFLIFNFIVDDDYVNKPIVCPNCGGKDIIYIDLNAIRDDPRVESGTVTRAFTHLDHLLLLDIDYRGDIRTINLIDKKQKISINQKKYDLILDKLDEYDKILLVSNDEHFQHLFQRITTQLEIDENYQLSINDNHIRMEMRSKTIVWVDPSKLDQIDPSIKWKGLFIEVDDNFDLSQFRGITGIAEKIIIGSDQLLEDFEGIFDNNKMVVLENSSSVRQSRNA